jgi:hypothetical protein
VHRHRLPGRRSRALRPADRESCPCDRRIAVAKGVVAAGLLHNAAAEYATARRRIAVPAVHCRTEVGEHRSLDLAKLQSVLMLLIEGKMCYYTGGYPEPPWWGGAPELP